MLTAARWVLKLTNLALGLVLLLCSTLPARAQVVIDDQIVQAGSSFIGQPHELTGNLSGIAFFTLRFAPVNGTLTTCSAAADSLLRPADWVTAGAAASQNCASAGTFSTTSALSANQVRLSVGTTGSGSVRVQLVGCVARCSVAAGAAVWGSITGTLSSQTDLQTAINSAGSLKTATVTITAAQLKALKATPITLVAAPGSGKILVPITMALQYKFVTTAYTFPSGDSLAVTIGGHEIDTNMWGTSAGPMTGLLDQVVSKVISNGIGVDPYLDQSDIANAPLIAANTSVSEWTLGGGTLTFTVFYTVVTLQ